MKLRQSYEAWKMLILTLPKGIVAFVVTIAGISIGLPLAVFVVGLPLLALMCAANRRMMEAERRYVDSWSKEETYIADYTETLSFQWNQSMWGTVRAVFTDAKSYRGIVYGFMQFPISVLAFTLAVVLPITAIGATLSPLAHEISMEWFQFDLFANNLSLDFWYFNLSSVERSWVSAGIGLCLLLATPFLLRSMAKAYASWIQGIAGTPIDKHRAVELH